MKKVKKSKKNELEGNANDYKRLQHSTTATRSSDNFSSAGRRKHLHPDLYRQIIEAIKSDRKTQNVTQRELSRRLRTVPSWIAKIETGERKIDLIELLDIYTSLGIDPLPRIDEILQKLIHKKNFDKK